MYYVKIEPSATGNHGNPVSCGGDGMATLPDTLLDDYISAMGFVALTVEDGYVTSLAVDQQALDAYLASVPEPEPEPPTEMEQLRADVDFLAAIGGVEL